MIRRSQARMVDCADSKTFSQSYVDGELAGPEREAWERHMESCSGCRGGTNFEARFKAAIRGHLPRRRLTAEFEQRIRGSIAQEPRSGRWGAWLTLPRLVPASVAAMGPSVRAPAADTRIRLVRFWKS